MSDSSSRCGSSLFFAKCFAILSSMPSMLMSTESTALPRRSLKLGILRTGEAAWAVAARVQAAMAAINSRAFTAGLLICIPALKYGPAARQVAAPGSVDAEGDAGGLAVGFGQ